MKVYILIGMIGSGKSSWAKMIAGTDFNTIRISSDDIRSMIKDRYTFDIQLEPLVDKMKTAMLVQLLIEGKNAVVDDIHLTKNCRRNLCATIAEVAPDAEIIYVWMKCDNDTALKRRLTNLREVSEFVWQQAMIKHTKMFEMPIRTENEHISNIIEVNNE